MQKQQSSEPFIGIPHKKGHFVPPKKNTQWAPKSEDEVIKYHKTQFPGLPETLYRAFGKSYSHILQVI